MLNASPGENPHAHMPALVVLVNSAAAWELLQHERWYRIPVRHAPEAIAAAHLAFYLSGRCGEAGHAVVGHAPVLAVRRVQRHALLPLEATHPRADDWYFAFTLGPIIPLPRPLPALKLRRITFIPTTLERLLTAREINDLWLHDDGESTVWRWFPDAALKATKKLAVADEPLGHAERFV